MSQLTDFHQIVGHTGHDLTRLVAVKELIGKLLEVIEHIRAHLGLHPYADHMSVILDEEAKQQTQSVEDQYQHTGVDDVAELTLGNVDIEHLVGQHRVYHTDHRNEKGGKHIQCEKQAVRFVIG